MTQNPPLIQRRRLNWYCPALASVSATTEERETLRTIPQKTRSSAARLPRCSRRPTGRRNARAPGR